MRLQEVIIFGGAGFIGTHFKVFFQENFPSVKIRLFDIVASEEVEYLDVREEIEGIVPSADTLLINLAAIHRTPGHPDYDYFETNIRGAENICQFAETHGINNIIFTSSIAPYGASEDLKTEATLTTPNTPYGISKLTSEHIHKVWAEKGVDRKLMILRPGVVFGKGENGNFTRLARILNKGFFLFPGRKDTIKACIYVKELVFQSWRLFIEQKSSVAIYNFAYFPSFSIKEIVLSIENVLGRKSISLTVPSWFLKLVAGLLQFTGIGEKIGVHPDRVKKLMISTNISGEKLHKALDGQYKFSFVDALNDWFDDCEGKGLY